GSGNGTSVHVVAYPDKTGGSCAGTPQGTADTSYVLDNTAPAVTGTASPTANAAGWNNSTPVTVTWAATDAGSGVKTQPSPATAVSAEGVTPLTSPPAVDNVGNSGTGTATVKIDKTPPTISASRSP